MSYSNRRVVRYSIEKNIYRPRVPTTEEKKSIQESSSILRNSSPNPAKSESYLIPRSEAAPWPELKVESA